MMKQFKMVQLLFYSLLFGGIQQGQIVPQLQKKAFIFCSKQQNQLKYISKLLKYFDKFFSPLPGLSAVPEQFQVPAGFG